MTYLRSTTAAAVAQVLETVDPAVSVFATPPATFNPPAFIVGYTHRVDYDAATFSIDDAELPVMVAVGLGEIDRVDLLAQQAKKALNADPGLSGTVQHVRVATQDNPRLLSIAGVDVLAVDLILAVRM